MSELEKRITKVIHMLNDDEVALDTIEKELTDWLAALPAAPAWSQEAPVKPGFYFWRADANDTCIEVCEVYASMMDKTLAVVFAEVHAKVDTLDAVDGQWSPIVPPEWTR